MMRLSFTSPMRVMSSMCSSRSGKVVDDERVGIGGGVVEGLDHGAAADGAGVAFEELLEVLVGPDEDGAVLHRAALAADGDLGLGFGRGGVQAAGSRRGT
jgi:hypothetical protein